MAGTIDAVDELLVEVRASTQGFSRTWRRCAPASTARWSMASRAREACSNAGCCRRSATAVPGSRISSAWRCRRSTRLPRRLCTWGSTRFSAARDRPAAGFGGGLLGGALGALIGLPGRATGGPVSPGRGYMVGERGPEMFVPTSAGRIETGLPGGRPREVRVSINLASPRGASAPTAMQRSSRQVASAVRRALSV